MVRGATTGPAGPQKSLPERSVESSVASVPLPGTPWGLGVDPTNGYVYVKNGPGNTVWVINGTALIASISVGQGPSGAIAFDPVNGDMYAANYGSGNVSLIRGTTVVGTIPTGGEPSGAVYNPTNGYVYVNNYFSNVSVISGTTVVANVSISGVDPQEAAVDPTSGDVYVPGYQTNNVTVIHGTSVLTSISIGHSDQGDALPNSATYDASDGLVYVDNFEWDNVSLINGTRLVGSIPVERAPFGGSFDPENGCVYVTDWVSNNVSVIRGTTVVGTIPVGLQPSYVAFDPANGYIYAENYASDNVSVIGLTFPVTFTESGLPNGAGWYLNITHGPSFHSTGSTVTFAEFNGTYRYTLGMADRLWRAPGGVFVVNGTPVGVSVTFIPVTYNVTFTESGLPYLASWYVNGTGFTSVTTVGTLAGSSESVPLQNGSYTYTVATGAAGYTVNRSTGTFIVQGAPVHIAPFAFAPPPGPATFLGLPVLDGVALLGAGVAAGLAGLAVAVFLRLRRGGLPPNPPAPPASGGSSPPLR